MAILGQISQVELDLRGELRKANRLISKESFKKAESSADEDKKKIADDYKELIEKANSIIANEKRTDADMSKLVEDLKNARTVIENLDPQNIAIAKINDYMELIRKVYNHPKYLDVAQNNKTILEKAVKAVEETDFTKEVPQDKLDSLISDLEAGLNASDIKAIVEEIKNNKESKLEDLVVNDLLEVAKKVQNHPDFNEVTPTNKESFKEALAALEDAIKSNDKEDIEDARVRLISLLNASDIKRITEEVLAQRPGKTDTSLESKSKELQLLISIGEKVQSHKDYEAIKVELKEELADAISKAKAAVITEDVSKIDQAFNKLNEVLAKEEFKDILKDIKDSMVNDYKTKIDEFIKGDASFRREIKYIKAQKSLKEAYIKALDDAKRLIEKSDASSEEMKDAYDKLFDARTNLDGDEFEGRLEALAKKYKDNSDKITDAKIKAALADKINALNEDGKTMDDLIAVENELTKALPKEGKVSVTTTGGRVQTPVTTTSTKTVPVTTTKSVPTTVTPGSIVRTGIDSVIGYVAVLAIAILGYLFVAKKGKKDNTSDKKEKYEGDKNDQYK